MAPITVTRQADGAFHVQMPADRGTDERVAYQATNDLGSAEAEQGQNSIICAPMLARLTWASGAPIRQ
jgi:hypothetical protein